MKIEPFEGLRPVMLSDGRQGIASYHADDSDQKIAVKLLSEKFHEYFYENDNPIIAIGDPLEINWPAVPLYLEWPTSERHLVMLRDGSYDIAWDTKLSGPRPIKSWTGYYGRTGKEYPDSGNSYEHDIVKDLGPIEGILSAYQSLGNNQ